MTSLRPSRVTQVSQKYSKGKRREKLIPVLISRPAQRNIHTKKRRVHAVTNVIYSPSYTVSKRLTKIYEQLEKFCIQSRAHGVHPYRVQSSRSSSSTRSRRMASSAVLQIVDGRIPAVMYELHTLSSEKVTSPEDVQRKRIFSESCSGAIDGAHNNSMGTSTSPKRAGARALPMDSFEASG